MTQVWTVFGKEMREALRDRRTLVVLVLLPLLVMPLLIQSMGHLAQLEIRAPVRVAVAEHSPGLFLRLLRRPGVRVDRTRDPAEAVRRAKADLGVKFLPSGEVVLYTDATRTASSRALAAGSGAVHLLDRVLAARALERHGLNPALLSPYRVRVVDLASKSALSGFLLGLILPLLLVIWSIAGGLYAAIDTSAGERERHTFEALLLTPARRGELVLGKLFAVASLSFVSAGLAIFSMVLSLGAAPLPGPDGRLIHVQLGGTAILLLVWLALLLSLAFSGLLLALGVLARNFKEGQAYVMPVYLVSVLGATLLNVTPGAHLGLWVYACPVLNAVVLFRQALLHPPGGLPVVLTSASLLAFAALSGWLAQRSFGRESLLRA